MGVIVGAMNVGGCGLFALRQRGGIKLMHHGRRSGLSFFSVSPCNGAHDGKLMKHLDSSKVTRP